MKYKEITPEVKKILKKNYINNTDLSGYLFRDMEIVDKEFADMDFRNIRLTGVTFHNCYFAYVDFTNSDLSETRFYDCDFSETNFSNTNLRHMVFKECGINFCNFNKANLYAIEFVSTYVGHCNFWNTDLDKLHVTMSNFGANKGLLKLSSEYPYLNYGYYYNGTPRICFGCYNRTLKEWQEDFWNNDNEFPKNSIKGRIRWNNFKLFKIWFKQQEKLISEYYEEIK